MGESNAGGHPGPRAYLDEPCYFCLACFVSVTPLTSYSTMVTPTTILSSLCQWAVRRPARPGMLEAAKVTPAFSKLVIIARPKLGKEMAKEAVEQLKKQKTSPPKKPTSPYDLSPTGVQTRPSLGETPGPGRLLSTPEAASCQHSSEERPGLGKGRLRREKGGWDAAGTRQKGSTMVDWRDICPGRNMVRDIASFQKRTVGLEIAMRRGQMT